MLPFQGDTEKTPDNECPALFAECSVTHFFGRGKFYLNCQPPEAPPPDAARASFMRSAYIYAEKERGGRKK